MRTAQMILVFSTSCLFIICCGCTAHSETQSPAAKSVEPTIVSVVKVKLDDLERPIELSGEFRAHQAVEVHAKVAGYLKEIYVDIGDRVKAGQLLGVLEVPEMLDEVSQAGAAIKRNAAEVLRARREYERAQTNQKLAELSHKRLLAVSKREPGLIAQQELDEALSRRQSAEDQVATAKAAIDVAEESVSGAKATEQRTKTMENYARVVAPFSGVVTKRFADRGTMIQAGTASHSQATPLVRIAQIDRLRLVLPIPESAVPSIRVGSPITIQVASLQSTFEGKIARVSNDLQLTTRTMDVEVDVPNPKGLLIPGMYATTRFVVDRRQHVLTVPAQALSGTGNTRSVFAVSRNGLLEDRKVKVGMELAGKTEVTNGVALDDLVVVGNRGQLKPGQRVETRLGGAE
ncbi:MAG: efflux RND transporter periplasmic adaptor subunit [Bryobacteraceae bacterium]